MCEPQSDWESDEYSVVKMVLVMLKYAVMIKSGLENVLECSKNMCLEHLKGQPANWEQVIMTLCHNILLTEFTNAFLKDLVVRKQG